MATKPAQFSNEDPRRLRELLARTCELAERHTVQSVVVGLAAREGDLLAPEIIDFIESALRVEDAIFRMTRERAVLFLTDVGRDQAERILTRILGDFSERFPTARGSAPEVRFGYFELGPKQRAVGLKDVLPVLFGDRSGEAHDTRH
ncbi:hypothetical protein MYXO_00321 [Myxococcaceae bacterium]|nr:hypothetical protein MYXO_00321 [Myxococcaceae bacterium]